MRKGQGPSSSLWTDAVIRAVALSGPMPGVEGLQQQYVRYSGQTEAQLSDDGWLYEGSQAQALKVAALPPNPPVQRHHSHHSDSGPEASASMSTTGPPNPAHVNPPNTPHDSGHEGGTFAGPPAAPASAAALTAGPTVNTSMSVATGVAGEAAGLPRGESEAMSSGRVMGGGASGLAPVATFPSAAQDAAPKLPQQVQLTVSTAPAEFCMPMKQDRQFKPFFQAQVRVRHDGRLRMPLRVGVFAISEDETARITEWLPREFVEPTQQPEEEKPRDRRPTIEEKLRESGLKTHTVLSHIFHSPGEEIHPSMRQESVRASPTAASHDRKPFFPSPSASVAGAPDVRAVSLVHEKSLFAQDDDPCLGSRVNLGGIRNTLLSQFDFHRLEFGCPSNVRPVHLVFACLVGNRDLLYTLYTVPSVSICRADQRDRALAVLGLPKNAFTQVKHVAKDDPAKPLAATVPTSPAASEPPLSVAKIAWPSPDPVRGVGAAAQHAAQTSQIPLLPTHQSTPPPLAAQPPPLISGAGASGGSGSGGIPRGQGMSPTSGAMAMSEMARSSFPQMGLDVAESRAMQMGQAGGEGAAQHAFGGAASGDLPWSFDPASMPFTDSFPIPPLLDKAPSTRDMDTYMPTSPTAPTPVSQPLPPSLQHRNPSSHTEPDLGSVSMSDAGPPGATQQHLQGRRSDPGRHPAFRGPGGAVSPSGYSTSSIPANPAPQPYPEELGVTQQSVYNWIVHTYNGSGSLRNLECVEFRSLLSLAGFPAAALVTRGDVRGSSSPGPSGGQILPTDSLLSLAGFPDLAGVDKSARISAQQFTDFRGFFLSTLASITSLSSLWNAREPCIVGGFDVDQVRAADALQPQPPGTFACFFSMQQQLAGHLVIACKVPPGHAGTDSTVWQPQIVYLAVSPDDLRSGQLQNVIMGLPYATHVLDIYRHSRFDKRSHLTPAPRRLGTQEASDAGVCHTSS